MTNMYGGGSPWFNEAGGGYGREYQPPQWGGGYQTSNNAGGGYAQPGTMGGVRGPGQIMPRQFGGGGGFQALANGLRMYGGRMGLMNGADGGVGTKPMQAGGGSDVIGGTMPMGGTGSDVVGGVMASQAAEQPSAAPQGVPGMSPDNFGAGNAQNAGAMALAQATGNQSGLQGAGSAGTNSAINAAGPGSPDWHPQDVANAGVMGGPASFRVPGFAAQSAQARGMTPQQYAAMQGNTGIAPGTTWDQVTM